MPARVRTWLEGYGIVVEAITPDAFHAEQLRTMLPFDTGARDARCDARFELRDDAAVLVDGRIAERWPDLESASAEFAPRIRRYVAEHSPTHVFVHAGVVGVGSGVVLLPGFSYSGKTTLVSRLVELGAVYFSDEYAPIDTDGRVHPFPQALRTRGHDGGTGTVLEVPPAQVGTAPAAVTLVVTTEFRPESRFAPDDGKRSEAALALLQHTVSVRQRPAAALMAVARAVTDACFLHGPRGEATEAARALIDRGPGGRI